MTQAARNIHSKPKKSVARRAALTGAADKRTRPPRLKARFVADMLKSAATGLDRSYRLADAAYMQPDTLPPLIMQAVFRELMIELRPIRDQVNLILERNGGQS